MRSQLEHCPIVWKPSSQSCINKLENLQKRAFKWIFDEEYASYSTPGIYLHKCKQLKILPVSARFDYHDLKFFHSVFYGLSCVTLPDYLEPFSGSRLRTCHMDRLCLVSKILPKNLISVNSSQFSNEPSTRGFSGAYFYRAHLGWNRLPIALKEISCPSEFKVQLLHFIWQDLANTVNSELDSREAPD